MFLIMSMKSDIQNMFAFSFVICSLILIFANILPISYEPSVSFRRCT